VTLSLCGAHLLGGCLLIALVSDPLEVLALELGEPDAVGLVGEVEVEDGPDERQAAFLTGKPADDLGAALDLAEGSLEQVRRPPPPAVAYRVAQVHDERVEIIGQALRGGGEARLIELPDEGLQALLGVLFVDCVIERLPVGVPGRVRARARVAWPAGS
jgi:hypothetical protein